MLQKNFKGRINDRRIKAHARLEETLRTSKTLIHKTPLEETDKKRISKEIKILESKILEPDIAKSIRTKKFRGTD